MALIRLRPRGVPRVLGALSAFLCAFCAQDKLAGGYDDVENPALTVSLRDTLGKPYGSAEVRLYARYQNPGEDSVPLEIRNVPAGASIKIRDTSLIRAMELSKARGTPWPDKDTIEFNLVASASGGEAFVGGFRLIKGSDTTFRFQRGLGGTFTYPDTNGGLEAFPIMAGPVLDFHGRIGTRGMDLGLKSVFIAGSPYGAKVESDGSFTLARLAAGRYDVKAVSADAKVYTAADSLITGSAYAPSDWSEADLIWVE